MCVCGTVFFEDVFVIKDLIFCLFPFVTCVIGGNYRRGGQSGLVDDTPVSGFASMIGKI